MNPLDIMSMFQCKVYPLEMFLNVRDDGERPVCAPERKKKTTKKKGVKPKWHAAFEQAVKTQGKESCFFEQICVAVGVVAFKGGSQLWTTPTETFCFP